MPTTSEPLTVRELRRRWKPHKERLQALRNEHPTAIRFHRACSWLSRAQEINGDEQSDFVLINQWIAFNALYGRWDASRCEPLPDRECWKEFLDRILALDTQMLVNQVLLDHRPLALRIFEDEYLSSYFWEEPTPTRRIARSSLRSC
jgi:hypothetical protein